MPGDATDIEKLTEVGRYALGVVWGDRHDSILPFRSLRRACPCEECARRPGDAPPAPDAERLAPVEAVRRAVAIAKDVDGAEPGERRDQVVERARGRGGHGCVVDGPAARRATGTERAIVEHEVETADRVGGDGEDTMPALARRPRAFRTPDHGDQHDADDDERPERERPAQAL